ncbi:copper resistance protein CopD [Helicobacter apodemus]|uniref:Copper resistance protein CopD n=1 Tax=Helicobacter apodemus TaxID=135569 RepID=A0A2U8FF40_9HELI|nr:copper resistance protein CopD [Helicobacter apodemus]AWI34900.1 copper resistance protein CopD [Helicobacter apodemus]
MDLLYPYFLTLHLVCAIIFLGYIFTDVVLLTPIRKYVGDEIANKVFSVISKRGVRIMPLCLALLVLTGGAMISRYIGSMQGYLQTSLQIFLVIKMCVALVIVLMVIISLSCKFLKFKNPLAQVIHPVALILGFIIVVLAKIAFYV